MTTTYTAAIDEMYGLVYDVIQNEITPEIGYEPLTFWQYTEKHGKPSRNKYWLRVSSQIVIESQETLSTACGDAGQKRYNTAGLLFIELYLPKAVGNSGAIGRLLGTMLRDKFRKAVSGASGIVYRNSRILDGLPSEDLFYRLNVVTEFEYDEIK